MNLCAAHPVGMAVKQLTRRLAGLLLAASTACGSACAAQSDMGTGIPAGFNMYETNGALTTMVCALGALTISFPAGCSNVTLTQATMGIDGYKLAVAALLMAKAANLQVRLYATTTRDSGCGVDMVQMNP